MRELGNAASLMIKLELHPSLLSNKHIHSFRRLTEEVPPFPGQAESVHCHKVNWDAGQCESTAAARVPGVRIQRQAHDEEADHCEGDCDHQGYLS